MVSTYSPMMVGHAPRYSDNPQVDIGFVPHADAGGKTL
jgi:hypothetical protein